MKFSASFSPANPTARAPVSIGELYSHTYQIEAETLTEKAAAYLEEHHEIPGVILLHRGTFHSMIPRARFFERLGHRFGVELFLRKPIIELQENLETSADCVSSYTRLQSAVNIALNRSIETMYDPLVVEYEDGTLRMLDIHTLLTAYASATENMSSVISNMHRIEHSIKSDISINAALDMILDSIQRAIPHHHALILIKPAKFHRITNRHASLTELTYQTSHIPFIKSVLENRQPIQSEHVEIASELGEGKIWLGLSISNKRHIDGALCLCRAARVPFDKNEIDMAKNFAELLSIAINKMADGYDERQFTDMIQRKFL